MSYDDQAIDMDALEDILAYVSLDNNSDFYTFENGLKETLGEEYHNVYDKLFDYMHYKLDITSDSDLQECTDDDKKKIISYLNKHIQ